MTESPKRGRLLMTVEDVAAYLQINPLTVRRLAREGAIPLVKIGRQWRTKQDLLDRWITKQSMANWIHQ
jgi:excisionase family DNA binding protein